MQDEVTCPVCQKRNKDTKLTLKQINYGMAVYFCPLKMCKYPKGYPWLVIKRTFDEFTNLISQSKPDQQSTGTKKKAKKSKFIKNAVKMKTQHSESFLNMLDELTNISVEAPVTIDQNDNEDNERQPRVQMGNSMENTELLDISLPIFNINNDNTAELKNTASSTVNETCFTNGMLNCNDYFSTSVADVLEDFIASGEMNDVDFNFDDLLDDAILGSNIQ